MNLVRALGWKISCSLFLLGCWCSSFDILSINTFNHRINQIARHIQSVIDSNLFLHWPISHKLTRTVFEAAGQFSIRVENIKEWLRRPSRDRMLHGYWPTFCLTKPNISSLFNPSRTYWTSFFSNSWSCFHAAPRSAAIFNVWPPFSIFTRATNQGVLWQR